MSDDKNPWPTVGEFADKYRTITVDPPFKLLPYQEQIMTALDPASGPDGSVVFIGLPGRPMARMMMPDDRASKSLENFRQRVFDSMASALGVSYADLTRDYLGVREAAAVNAVVERIMHRAAHAATTGKRGWQRKLKRARRIQIERLGANRSDAWFSLTWNRIISRFRLRAWQSQIYKAWLDENAEWIKELKSERLTPDGWKPIASFRDAFRDEKEG